MNASTFFRALTAAAGAAIALLALTASPAMAGGGQVSVMMDDDQLLYGTDVNRQQALDSMRILGVDAVRVTVLWKVVAPRRRPKGFDPRNPAHYHSGILNRFDRLVTDAYARGVTPYFNLTWPGPTWGHAKPPNKRLARLGTYRPKRREFGKFVEMIGKRYSGTYVDENDGNQVLPAVRIWALGNEPNQGGWLTPQSTPAGKGKRRRWVPAAPRIYRDLFVSARRGLKITGHDADVIMMGELAPIGRSDQSATSPIRPVRFLNEMFCLDSRSKPYRGASAKLRGCKRVPQVRATAIAYHPYTSNRNPLKRPRNREEISMGNIKQLSRLLDRIAKRTGKLGEGMRVWLTEFGYETDPPDAFHGVSLEQQSKYINIGDFLAYRDSRVDAQTQFLLVDAKPFSRFKRNSKPYWLSYQSGLIGDNAQAKPAFGSYALPVHVQDISPGRKNVWGQLRFRPNAAPHSAEIQFRADGTPAWNTIAAVTTNNPLGFFEQAVGIAAKGFLRASWRDPADGQLKAHSREVAVKP